MKFLTTFLEEHGVKNFVTDCFFVKSYDGREVREFLVNEDECFVCEKGESLWDSNEDSIEFTLFCATQETEVPESIRFLCPIKDFSIKENNKLKNIINIFNKDKILFSIEDYFIF